MGIYLYRINNLLKVNVIIAKSALFIIMLFSINSTDIHAQNFTCATSEIFCASDVFTYPAGVNSGFAEDGPDYGCVATQENPAWYHLRICTPGDMDIQMSSSPSEDIDFVCWGPFDEPYDPCSGQLTASNEKACSYSISSIESFSLTDTQSGEFYIFMITNFSNDPCEITLTKTAGDGDTFCPGTSNSNSPVCAGETLELYAESYDNASYLWEGPNGYVSTDQNPIIANVDDSYDGIFSLTITMPGNDPITACIGATVNSATADFISTDACPNQTVFFTDQSTSSDDNIVSRTWNFGDGTPTSGLVNPSHVYTSAGTYNVELQVTSGDNCVDNITQPLELAENPVADFSFTFSNNTPCANADVVFTDLSTPTDGSINSWEWNFGDGNISMLQNPTHSYINGGTYIVELTVSNSENCEGVTQQTVIINPPPTIDFSFTEVCVGTATQFIDSDFINMSSTASWHYDFGDGESSNLSNPSHTFVSSGSFEVEFSITDNNNCSNSIVHAVPVGEYPTADYSFNSACQFGVTEFIDESVSTSAITNWTWDFGDGATSFIQHPSHIYTVSSNEIFPVELTVTNEDNCSNSIIVDVQVFAKPIADFSYSYISGNSCINEDIQFYDNSTSVEGTIISRHWNFGDGSPEVLEENPIHSFAASGTYQVGLTVENTAGCDSTIYIDVVVNGLPSFNFTFTEECEGIPTEFTDVNVPSAISRSYDFGDNSNSSEANPSHLYEAAGSYNVELFVTDLNGCYNSISHSVNVFDTPVVDFTSDTVCQGSLTSFADLSTSSSTITNWQWDFGDGNTSDVQDPQHLYSVLSNEIFNANLLVTTSESCSNDITKDVLVLGKPISNFSYNFTTGNQCIASEVVFNNLSTTTNGIIEISNWDFGDGNTTEDTNPVHSFSSEGIYDITLTVINSAGCDSTIQQQITIYPNPELDFSFTHVCFNTATQFTDSPYVNVDATATWLYDFSDGNTSDQSNPLYLFNEAGIHNVTLAIVDTNGCANSISHDVQVYDNAVADFLFDSVCQFFPTHYTDLSYPSSAAESWLWNFDDGQTSILQNPQHTYDTSGFYNVQLVVGNNNGCNDTIIQEVWVYQPPIANYNYYDTVCTTGLVYFRDSSYSYESSIEQYQWNFPDGHVSFDPDTYFVFLSQEVSYNIPFSVTDARGCSDTIRKDIYIKPDLQIGFRADTVCFGQETTLSAFIIKPQDDSIFHYAWVYGDGGPQIITPNSEIRHEFLEAGIFEPRLQATNIYGCTDEFRKKVKIRENPASGFSFQESYCNDSTLFIDASIEGEGEIDSWNWYYGDGESLLIVSPNNPDNYHFYDPIYGDFLASLRIEDEHGCIDSIVQNVLHYPCVYVNFYNDTSWICQNTSAVFIDSTVVDSDFSVIEKTWYFGDGSSMNVPPEIDTIEYQYQENGSYLPKLVISYEGEGLTFDDSTQRPIEILASPKLSYIKDSVCFGVSTEIINYSYINDNQLSLVYWNFGDGRDTVYSYKPAYTSLTHNYTNDGHFSLLLKMTAENNCVDSLTETVLVYPVPNIGFKADSTIYCDNAIITLTDTSHINSGFIANRLWTFGDGDYVATAEDTISHLYNRGEYTVSLENISDHYCKNKITYEDFILINPIIEADFEITPKEVSIHGKSSIEVTNYTADDTYFRWALSDTILWENIYTPNIADSIFDTGRYELKMYTVNEYGCIDSLSNYFNVTPAFSFFLPTGFSPNGNDVNDTFGPIGKYFEMGSYSLKIYSRWGEMVFETDDFYKHWDGKTRKGEIAPVDTYGWLIQLIDMDGNIKVMRGGVTLLL